jgi:hypothetical protein
MTDGPTIPPPPPSTGGSSFITRAINILTKPNEEWGVIDAEQSSIASIFTGYVLILAAIGPIAIVIGQQLISGAWKSTPCAAAISSTATTPAALRAICRALRAAIGAIETWSSWPAEVGIESTLAGKARLLFSLTKAAAVTCGIISPN